jgi:type II secretory pathway component GspD/PulD (secretin)
MDSVRRIVASFLAAVFLAGALAAQTVQVQANELILHAYALKYRQAGEAVSLVSPLLSRAGTVELQPGSNTLVIRDTPASLNKITMVLRSYDQPARPVILELYIVRASRSQVSPPTPRSDLPEPLTRGLR